jgi:hypothetical protein
MLDSDGSGWGSVTVFYFSELGFGPVKGGDFLGELSDFQVVCLKTCGGSSGCLSTCTSVRNRQQICKKKCDF